VDLYLHSAIGLHGAVLYQLSTRTLPYFTFLAAVDFQLDLRQQTSKGQLTYNLIICMLYRKMLALSATMIQMPGHSIHLNVIAINFLYETRISRLFNGIN
jgi:hypothetical protein